MNISVDWTLRLKLNSFSICSSLEEETDLFLLLQSELKGKPLVFFQVKIHDDDLYSMTENTDIQISCFLSHLTDTRFQKLNEKGKFEVLYYFYSLRYSNSSYAEFHEDLDRYYKQRCKSQIAYGESVGVVAAQSVSERFTQSALNTFHLSGTKASALTGISRILELFDALKTLKLPILYPIEGIKSDKLINKFLLDESVSSGYTIVKYKNPGETPKKKIKKKKTKKMLEWVIKIDIVPECTIDLGSICKTLKTYMGVKSHTSCKNSEITVKFEIQPDNDTTKEWAFVTRKANQLNNICVSGLTNCITGPDEEGMITFKSKSSMLRNFSWIDLFDIQPTFDFTKLITNDIFWIEEHLGIEAVRSYLYKEIQDVLSAEGIQIDCRHISIIVDNMVVNGCIQANKYSSLDINDSVILKASFEQATNTLGIAASKNVYDNINNVSSSVMFGKRANIGSQNVHIITSSIVGDVIENNTEYDPLFPSIETYTPEDDVIVPYADYTKNDSMDYDTSSTDYIPPPSPEYRPSSPVMMEVDTQVSVKRRISNITPPSLELSLDSLLRQ